MKLLKGSDGYVRGAKVEVGKTKNIIRRPVNRLYPTKVHWSDPRERNYLMQKTLLMAK